jgi:hypothetical protein
MLISPTLEGRTPGRPFVNHQDGWGVPQVARERDPQMSGVLISPARGPRDNQSIGQPNY